MKFVSYDSDIFIQIDRNKEFLTVAKELSNYLNSLDLPPFEHNKLVQLIIKNVKLAERSSFFEGAKIGFEYRQYDSPKTTETDELQKFLLLETTENDRKEGENTDTETAKSPCRPLNKFNEGGSGESGWD